MSRETSILAMRRDFDPDDYSVVVKHRADPPKPWRWEIYRAGRRSPIKQSSIFFRSVGTAHLAGKEALTALLRRSEETALPREVRRRYAR
jgi:hypothetical protein